MKLIIGIFVIFLSCAWLFWMSKRRRQPISLKQAIIDFVTGSSPESVLSIGIFLLGCLLIAAYLFNSK